MILIVESDESMAATIKAVVEESGGFQAVISRGPDYVMSEILSLGPELIIMDFSIVSPNITKTVIQLASQIVPMLVISTAFKDDVSTKLHLPRLTKPFDVDDLLRAIKQAMKKA